MINVSNILMLESSYVKESLSKLVCYSCGASLEEADLLPITQASVLMIAHVVCSKCKAQSIATLTPAGIGTVPLVSDLYGAEVKKFISMDNISYDDILKLHTKLKNTNIWNLLQKKDKYLGKRQKVLEKKEKYQL